MKLLIRPDGTAVAVYSDTLPLAKLGDFHVQRASNVEFNNITRRWEARLPDGTLIAEDPKRQAVIDAEVMYLEKNLSRINK